MSPAPTVIKLLYKSIVNQEPEPTEEKTLGSITLPPFEDIMCMNENE